MRQTSIETYRQIEKEGLLSRLRWKVYQELFKHGPCTQGELYKIMQKEVKNYSSLTPRFAELERRGAISSSFYEKRPCKETGRVVHVWDVTSKLPLQLKSPKKTKCKACNGKGYTVEKTKEEQMEMF